MRCDLLESSYLCGRINNTETQELNVLCVVICSKVPTFVVESTTREKRLYQRDCCDLLESSYLCGRINNIVQNATHLPTVVICSKVPTFVVESTTMGRRFEFWDRL